MWTNRWNLCEYIKTGDDYLSGEIRKFKNGDPTVKKAWSSWMIDGIVANLIEQGVTPNYCVRALRSSETKPTSDAPLYDLATTIDSKLGITFIPDLIGKTASIKKLSSIYSAAGREAEIAKTKFYINNSQAKLNKSVILVLDDVKTTGTTARAICQLLLESYKNVDCYLYTLAENNNNITANNDEKVKIYNQHLAKFAK